MLTLTWRRSLASYTPPPSPCFVAPAVAVCGAACGPPGSRPSVHPPCNPTCRPHRRPWTSWWRAWLHLRPQGRWWSSRQNSRHSHATLWGRQHTGEEQGGKGETPKPSTLNLGPSASQWLVLVQQGNATVSKCDVATFPNRCVYGMQPTRLPTAGFCCLHFQGRLASFGAAAAAGSTGRPRQQEELAVRHAGRV